MMQHHSEVEEMVLTIASGKGGTGKTTVAVNLAVALQDRGVQLLDCDVEEPNAHLFMKPDIRETVSVTTEVPKIDAGLCNYCGKCRDICQFNAIAILPTAALVFPELCHSCGGCFRVCPEHATLPSTRVLGEMEKGQRGPVEFVHGRLRVGEAMAPPLIRKIRAESARDRLTIIDAPPGTSCPVVAAMKGSDFIALVTEPTPFGLNDLELAVGAVRKLALPMGVVINRSDLGDDRVHKWLAEENIPLLLEIPFDRKVAEGYARGELLAEVLPAWKGMMLTLHGRIMEEMERQA
ncbi:MAG: ATP-binding protein [Syntrophobacteraceae bacterium]